MTGENEASPDAQHAQDDDDPLTPRVIHLTPEAFADFLAIVSAPATVVPEIVAIAAHRAPWETDRD